MLPSLFLLTLLAVALFTHMSGGKQGTGEATQRHWLLEASITLHWYHPPAGEWNGSRYQGEAVAGFAAMDCCAGWERGKHVWGEGPLGEGGVSRGGGGAAANVLEAVAEHRVGFYTACPEDGSLWLLVQQLTEQRGTC